MPPPILAVVMVLQRLEGLSDREAADRFAFDVRWRYAAGVGGHGASLSCGGPDAHVGPRLSERSSATTARDRRQPCWRLPCRAQDKQDDHVDRPNCLP
ncbi:MAG TPA: transposase [Actinomycetes bacterium]|nr:transposase [Actinomycetes bacterium]